MNDDQRQKGPKKIKRLIVKSARLNIKEIFIDTDFIKLDSALKLCGIAQTGGHAKLLIQDGEIFVNNEICTLRGKKLRNGDLFRHQNMVFKVISRTV